LTADVAQ